MVLTVQAFTGFLIPKGMRANAARWKMILDAAMPDFYESLTDNVQIGAVHWVSRKVGDIPPVFKVFRNDSYGVNLSKVVLQHTVSGNILCHNWCRWCVSQFLSYYARFSYIVKEKTEVNRYRLAFNRMILKPFWFIFRLILRSFRSKVLTLSCRIIVKLDSIWTLYPFVRHGQ